MEKEDPSEDNASQVSLIWTIMIQLFLEHKLSGNKWQLSVFSRWNGSSHKKTRSQGLQGRKECFLSVLFGTGAVLNTPHLFFPF